MVLRSGTDRDGANGSGGNHNRNNDIPLPDPPVHPTLADVLAQHDKRQGKDTKFIQPPSGLVESPLP